MKTIKNLLSKGNTNTKTAKNDLKTFILYLSPANQNSKKINLCPFATPGCLESCLYTAGRGKFNNVQQARQNRTEYMIKNKGSFYFQIAKEINNKIKYYTRREEVTAYRLNGTSDVDHIKALKSFAGLDIATLKNVAQFYDYTKSLKRALKYKDHPNYTVTLSRSENNWSECITALNNDINVAAVFAGELPETYKGYKVIDGDKADDIMIKHKGVILGLRAKGEAKKDKTNFVITKY